VRVGVVGRSVDVVVRRVLATHLLVKLHLLAKGTFQILLRARRQFQREPIDARIAAVAGKDEPWKLDSDNGVRLAQNVYLDRPPLQPLRVLVPSPIIRLAELGNRELTVLARSNPEEC